MGFDTTNPFSRPASGDLSASQYCGVTLDTNGRLALPSAGGSIIGVLYTKPTALDKAGEVFGPGSGIRKIKYGGTITAGDVLKVASDGRFVTASASDVAAGSGVAIAVEGGSANDIREGIVFAGAGAASAIVGDETVTTGALSAFKEVSYISINATKAYTLPDGKYTGQRRRVEVSVAAATPAGTLTVTTPLSGEAASYLLDTVAQSLTFIWQTGGWHLVEKKTAGKGAFTVGTNNIAIGDMHSQCDLTVVGTVASSLGAGQIDGEMKHITVASASGTPHGSVTGAFATKIGAASATWGSGTDITSTASYLWVRWSAGDAKWHEVISATALFA